MNELPSDPSRLRAILAFLDQRVVETEIVATYLRLQITADRQALVAAEKQAPDVGSCRRSRGRLSKDPRSRRQPGLWWRSGCTVIQSDANPIGVGDARQVVTGDRRLFRTCDFCNGRTYGRGPGARGRGCAS
ncbi:hypothetical protein ABT272_44430 [Streptomyces sp900105245]|uniref:Uncharacterized protein n=1 Tax=Streptomyces sp. 900105245 TaxID=3154379 RepID=A0ABV1ULJ6_9ACTN